MLKQINNQKEKCQHSHDSDINVKQVKEKLNILVEKIKVFQNLNTIKKSEKQKKYYLLDGLRKLLEVIGIVITEELTQITRGLIKIEQKLRKDKKDEKSEYYQSIKANQEYISKIKGYLLQQHEIKQHSNISTDQIKNKQINCCKVGKFRKTKNSTEQQISSSAVTPTWKQDQPKFYDSFEHQPNSPPSKQQVNLNMESKEKLVSPNTDIQVQHNQIINLKTTQSYLKINPKTVDFLIDAKNEYKFIIQQSMAYPITKNQIQKDIKMPEQSQFASIQKLHYIRNNSQIPLSRSIEGPGLIQVNKSQTREQNNNRNSIYGNIRTTRNLNNMKQAINNRYSIAQQNKNKDKQFDISNPENSRTLLLKSKSQQQLYAPYKYKKMTTSLGQNKKSNSILQQVDKLKQEVAYYFEKYQNYKNIADSQEELISSLRQQLKQYKYHLNNAKTIAKCNLQGNLKVKAAEIARLNQELAECKKTITELQVKIKFRNNIPLIQICQEDKQTAIYVKQLQKMLDQQETFLVASNNRIKQQQTQIQKLTIANLNQQKQLHKLYEVLSSIQQQSIRAIQEKTQAHLMNKKMKKVIERQQEKLQAMGVKILQIAQLNINTHKHKNG